MSQRAVLRGFLLCTLPLLAALSAEAQQSGSLTITPSRIGIRQGSASGPVTAQLTAFIGATGGPGILNFDGLPGGISTSPSPVTITIPPNQSTGSTVFQFVAAPDVPVGVYSEIFVGVSPYQLYTFIEIEVLPALPPIEVGALGASIGSAAMSICAGGDPVENFVDVTPLEGYRGSPTVSFPGLPEGIVITPSVIPVPQMPPGQTVSFAVSVLPGAPAGVHTVKVLVRDARTAASTSFTVEVLPSDFTPAVAPASLALGAGGTPGTLTASISAGNCSPPPSVTVTPSGLPAGVTVAPASAVLSAPAYTPVPFVFTAAADAPVAAGAVTLTFTPSTGATKTATVPASVRRLGSLAAAIGQARIDLCAGGAALQNTVTVTPVDGYEGSPVVTFPGLPEGLVVSQASIPVPPLPPARVVAFGISAAPGTAPGERTVEVRVADPAGPSATTSFAVFVRPPNLNPSLSPATLPLNAGGPAAALVASFVPGSCAPTSDVTVAPASLPPGITVTPASAVLAAPGFAPATFMVQASSSAAPGAATISFSFTPGGGPPALANAGVVVCGPPPAPVSPRVSPQGNPQGPVTATDFLALSWTPATFPFPQTRFEWRINGEPWASAAGTIASAPPRGKVDPVQLFVRGFACAPELGPGPEAASPVYPLAPPVADFAVPATLTVGRPATFTDTSSPQATSWLWFPGDGLPAVTAQSPTVTFTSAGTKVVVLVATNGSGSSSKTKTVSVFPPVSAPALRSSATRTLDRQPDGRLALARVQVEAGTALQLRRLEGEGEAVAFLRLVDSDGSVVVERRLVLAAGEEARHDLSAWGATGPFRVEVVGPEGLEAAVEEMAVAPGGPEQPVGPRSLR